MQDHPVSDFSNANGREKHVSGAEVRADFGAIRRDLSALRDDLISLGAAKAGEAGEQVDARLRRVRENASALLTKIDSQTKSLTEKVSDNVREHPVAALGSAVALGFVVGGILFKSRR